jgi:hypothetical protein
MSSLGRKGQFIIFSTIVLLFLFFLIFTLFFDYLVVIPSISTDEYKFLQEENTRVAEYLLLPGYPISWDNNNVLRVGLVDGDVINETKLAIFKGMSEDLKGYERSKALLGMYYDYLIVFKKDSSVYNGLPSIGMPGIATEDELLASKPATISIQERLVMHEVDGREVPVTMKVYVFKRGFV